MAVIYRQQSDKTLPLEVTSRPSWAVLGPVKLNLVSGEVGKGH